MALLIKNATLLSKKKADILIESGRIAKIGTSLSSTGAEKLDASGKLLLPGFINTHTHAAMTLFRGVGEDRTFHGWLSAVRALETKVTPQQIRAGSELACIEMVKSGTTCFNDMYFYMDELAGAVKEIGMRAVLGYSMVDMGDEKKRKLELEICEKFIKDWQGKADGRITCSVPPHSLYLCSRELLEASRDLSAKYKVQLHIHLSETRKEVFDCLSAHKKRPVYYLDSLGILSSRTVAAHCVWFTKEEIKLLSSRGVSASLNTVSNLKLAGGGIAPLPEMEEAKMNISLGTDGSASNNSLSMFEAMKFTSLCVKNARWDASVAKEHHMVSYATEGGARALGIQAGEIKEGKLADMILLDAKAANLVPHHDLYSNIVFSANAGNVTDSIINGKLVMENRKLLTMDEEKAIERAEKAVEKLEK